MWQRHVQKLLPLLLLPLLGVTQPPSPSIGAGRNFERPARTNSLSAIVVGVLLLQKLELEKILQDIIADRQTMANLSSQAHQYPRGTVCSSLALAGHFFFQALLRAQHAFPCGVGLKCFGWSDGTVVLGANSLARVQVEPDNAKLSWNIPKMGRI